MPRKANGAARPVALQYMSDLHLERVKYDFEITRNAPILLLAGDIGRFCDGELYRAFLEKQCDQFDMVLLIAGNHEFYGCTREDGLRIAQGFIEDSSMHGKLHFLNRTRIDLPDSGVTVLGCTLHSHIAPDYTKLTNDFQRIKDWRVKDHNAEHQLDLAWLESSCIELSQESAVRRIVIVTHYAPTFERTCHPLNENNAVSQCFSSHTLRYLLALPQSRTVRYWIFGHTHWNCRFNVDRVTVLCNQFCNDSHNLTWWQKRFRYRPFNPRATISI